MLNEDDIQAHLSNEEELTEFSQVRRRKRTVGKLKNPLYQVFNELQQGAGEWVQSVRWTPLNSSERETFLIHLDTPPPHPLYDGFQERHFSIDKFHKHTSLNSEQHGYTPIHYTEVYQVDKETIVVHAYLDRNGRCVYSQSKAFRGKTPSPFKEEKGEKELLNINVITSIQKILPLVAAQKERFLAARKQVDKLERELRELSRRFDSDLDSYKAKANQLLESIAILDRYSELRDPRTKVISETLKILKQGPIKTRKPELLIQSVESAEPLDLSSVSNELSLDSLKIIEAKKSQEILAAYNLRMKELEDLIKQLSVKISYKAQNIKEIQERHKLCQEVNNQVIHYFVFSDSLSSYLPKQHPKFKKAVKKLLGLVGDHEKAGILLLKEELLKVNVDNVKILLVLFEENLKDDFYIDFISHLTEENLLTKKRLIEIACFLDSHSPRYRSILSELSMRGRYRLSKELISKLGEAQLIKKFNLNLTYVGSLLFKVFCNGDLDIFEMLLSQDASANSWGIDVEENKISCSTLFHQISLFENMPQYYKYLKVLLCYGASSDELFDRLAQKSHLKGQLQVKRELDRQGLIGEGVLLRAYKVWPLLDSMQKKEIDCFRILLPTASLGEIAYALAFCSNKECFRVMRKIGVGENICLRFLEDRKSALELDHNLFFELSIYKDPKNFRKEDEPLYQMITEAYTLFCKRIKGVRLEEFESIFKKLISRRKASAYIQIPRSSLEPGEIEDIYGSIIGCEFLVAAHAMHLSSKQERFAFLTKFYKEEGLLSEIVPAFSLCYEKENFESIKKTYEQFSVDLLKKNSQKRSVLKIADSRDQKIVQEALQQPPMFGWQFPSKAIDSEDVSKQLAISFKKSKTLLADLVDMDFNQTELQVQEFGITTPTAKMPILAATDVRTSYFIAIFHKSRTCVIHWYDNASHKELERVINKFLRGAHTPAPGSSESLPSQNNSSGALASLISDESALSPKDCEVAIIGGWSDHLESCKAGKFALELFGQLGFERLNRDLFQYKKSIDLNQISGTKGRGNQHLLTKASFCYVAIDARTGQIKFSDDWSTATKASRSLASNWEQRLRRIEFSNSIHLQDDRYPESGTKLVSINDYSSLCNEQLKKFFNLAFSADLKGLQEFLETMVIDINVRSGSSELTPLHCVCRARSATKFACAELLIAHGADPTLKDKSEKTAFDLLEGDRETIEKLQLLWRIIESNLVVEGQKFLLEYALYKRHPEQLDPETLHRMKEIFELLETSEGRKILKQSLLHYNLKKPLSGRLLSASASLAPTPLLEMPSASSALAPPVVLSAARAAAVSSPFIPPGSAKSNNGSKSKITSER